MAKVHSHYDNLKVARNAPPEVIRAAYRALAQRYHPDVSSNPDAARVMKLLNEAWDVLGDPEKRAMHDKWLQEQDRLADDQQATRPPAPDFGSRKTYTYTYTSQAKPNPSESDFKTSSQPPRDKPSDVMREAFNWAKHRDTESSNHKPSPTTPISSETGTKRTPFGTWIGIFALGTMAAAIVFSTRTNVTHEPNRPGQQSSPSQSANAPSSNSSFDRCKGSYEVEKCEALERRLLEETPEQRLDRQRSLEATRRGPSVSPPATVANLEAPSVQPDPEQLSRTGYVPGSLKGASGGLSDFTVDNTSGGGDAIARLYLGGKKPGVRTFFIKKGERFTVSSLAPGPYVLRYRYMGSDETYEADREFALRQVETEDGTSYSRVRVTLYTVRDGNMQTKTVPKDQF